MQRDPSRRYQTADEMLAALEATPEGRHPPDPDEAPAEPVARGKRGGNTQAESPSSRKRIERDGKNPLGFLVAGVAIGAVGVTAAALALGLGSLGPSPRPPAGPSEARLAAAPPAPALPAAPAIAAAAAPVPPAAPPPPAIAAGPDSSPPAVASAVPAPAVASAAPAPAAGDGGPDDSAGDDGEAEDLHAPPAAPREAPHREVPQVREHRGRHRPCTQG